MIDIGFKTDNINYSNCYLSVSLEADRFFYGVFNKEHHLLESGFLDLQETEILNEKFLGKMVVSTEASLHLPAAISHPDLTRPFLAHFPDQQIFLDKLIDQDARSNYIYAPSAEALVANDVSGTKPIHLSTIISNYLYPAIRDKAFAFIADDTLHFCHYGPDGLKYYNHFSCRAASDYLYFLGSCFEMQGLSYENQPLELAGRIDKDSEISAMLHKYFGNLTFSAPALLKIVGVQNPRPHYFMDLYMAYLCAL